MKAFLHQIGFHILKQVLTTSDESPGHHLRGVHASLQEKNPISTLGVCPFRDDLPIKGGDFHSYVSLPEGTSTIWILKLQKHSTRVSARMIHAANWMYPLGLSENTSILWCFILIFPILRHSHMGLSRVYPQIHWLILIFHGKICHKYKIERNPTF